MKTNNIAGDLLIADANPQAIRPRGRTFVVAGILATLFGVFNVLLFFGFCSVRGTPAIVAGATMVAVSCVELVIIIPMILLAILRHVQRSSAYLQALLAKTKQAGI
jgi:thiamine transporter ThiT